MNCQSILFLSVGLFCGCASDPRMNASPDVENGWYSVIDAKLTSSEREAREYDAVPPLPDNPTREQAHQFLLKTNEFADIAVGYAGSVSSEVRAFQRLLKEKDAAAAFRDLVRRGALPGQLYGLCGLYLRDRESFQQLVQPYRKDTRKVNFFSGCMSPPESVAKLVEDNSPDTVRLKPGQTLAQWYDGRKNEWGYVTEPTVRDIVGGGFPCSFESAR